MRTIGQASVNSAVLLALIAAILSLAPEVEAQEPPVGDALTLTLTLDAPAVAGPVDFVERNDGSISTLSHGESVELDAEPFDIYDFEIAMPIGASFGSFECSGTSTYIDDGDTLVSVVLEEVDVECTVTLVAVDEIGLTFTKNIVDGDTTESFDFWLETVDLSQVWSFTLAAGESTVVGVPPGQRLYFYEGSAGAWAMVDLTCDGATAGVEFGTFTIDTGDIDAACTIVNAPQAPLTLTLEKQAVGSDGRVFDLVWDTGESFTLADGEVVERTIFPNTSVSFSEFHLGSWGAEAFECVGSDSTSLSIDLVTGISAASIAVGEVDVSCVLTNVELTPVDVTITKRVHGSDRTPQFALTDIDSGDHASLGDGDTHTFTVLAGSTLHLYEELPVGWDAIDLSCDFASSIIHRDLGGAFMDIEVADVDVSCELANLLVAPPVVVGLTKLVVGGDGTELFDLYDVGSGDGVLLGDGDWYGFVVEPGSTLLLEELLPPGWSAVDLVCDEFATEVTLDDFSGYASISIGVGIDDVSCELTNAADSGLVDVSITKLTTDGRTDDLFGFLVEDVATGAVTDHVLAHGETAYVQATANSEIVVYESSSSEWKLADIDCGDAPVLIHYVEAGVAEMSVTLGDQPVDCFVTNESLPAATLTLINSAPGATEALGYEWWTFPSFQTGEFALFDGESIALDLAPGDVVSVWGFGLNGWRLDEVICDGATIEFWPPDGVEIALAEADAVCTLIHRPPPVLRVTASSQGYPGGAFGFESNAESFTLGDGESYDIDVLYGWEVVAQWVPEGWEIVDIECSADSSLWHAEFVPGDRFGWVDVVFPPDVDLVECMFTNRPEPGSITITPTVLAGAPRGAFWFYGPDGWFALAGGDTIVHEVTEAGEYRYSIDLRTQPGWRLNDIACSAEDPVVTMARSRRSGSALVAADRGVHITCEFIVSVRAAACTAPGHGSIHARPCRSGPR